MKKINLKTIELIAFWKLFNITIRNLRYALYERADRTEWINITISIQSNIRILIDKLGEENEKDKIKENPI